MGKVDIPDEENLIIRFDKDGFWINGTLIDYSNCSIEDERPTNSYVDYFMPHFQGNLNLQIGSRQGNSRSYAQYDYIMYHKNL